MVISLKKLKNAIGTHIALYVQFQGSEAGTRPHCIQGQNR